MGNITEKAMWMAQKKRLRELGQPFRLENVAAVSLPDVIMVCESGKVIFIENKVFTTATSVTFNPYQIAWYMNVNRMNDFRSALVVVSEKRTLNMHAYPSRKLVTPDRVMSANNGRVKVSTKECTSLPFNSSVEMQMAIDRFCS